MSANDRVLDVNAFTTLDLVDASARGPDWSDDGAAVLDVRVPDSEAVDGDAPDDVVLELELDPTSHRRLEPHADRVALTREQARTLADALVAAVEGDDRREHDGR